jgi:predicted O-methyltransferase YrrM
MIELTEEIINKINYDEYFIEKNKIVDKSLDFYNKTGKDHYRLLSYLSSLYNNCNIIDIGTNKGYSALALSYNSTNTIYTFDSKNLVCDENIRNKNNINFNIENIFEEDVDNININDKWKEIILNSKFIFLDIEPHKGIIEYKFYLFLLKNKYSGFLVCDDIWYFKEMRDNFWYKLNQDYCYDLTEFGHWSGTGIITFNENYKFQKKDVSNWTLVTAYFDLTKMSDASASIKQRDSEYYFKNSLSTLFLPYNLIVFCDKENLTKIQTLRPYYLKDKTYYYVCDFNELSFKKNGKKLEEKFSHYREKIIENRKKNPYHFDDRNTASYYLFCMSRYLMMKEVINVNMFNSSHFCWINFCIERMGYRNLIHLNEALSINRDKFSTCYINFIPEEIINDTPTYYQYGRCGMCSGFFTGNYNYMYKVCDLIENKFLEYLEKGYGHADEQLYSPVYFENQYLFEHYYGDYEDMITNYAYIYNNPNFPIGYFLRNSFYYKYYNETLNACKFIYRSYNLKKIEINDEYLNMLKNYEKSCMEILNIKTYDTS